MAEKKTRGCSRYWSVAQPRKEFITTWLINERGEIATHMIHSTSLV